MSFNAGTLNVGTLTATFQLNASGAMSAIQGVNTQTNNLKNSFNQTFNIKVDSASAVSNINKATSALDIFKKGFEFAGGMQALGLLEKGIGAIKDAFIDTNASIQQSQLKFEAFTGSVQTASTLMTQLENIASHSTFGLAQITEASGQLLAFQVNARNVPALMAAIQNASAAAGGNMAANFTNLTRVIGELAGGLPLTERQVRQLVTAGVPLGPLADQLGVTVDQLLNTGKTGQVSGDQLVAAFAKVYNDGKLGDFMQKQAGTFNGAVSLIKTNLQLASASAFRPFFDEISGTAVKIGELVQTPTFQSWVDNISKAVAAATDVLRTFLGVLAPVAEGVAATFGINTGNLSAEMAAAAKAKPTFSPYDPSLQGGADTAKQSAADLAQQQIDALGNVKTAVASLDEAMGFPNGQAGIEKIVANLGTLEKSASGETTSAIKSVNDALALPEGSIGPKQVTSYLGELKIAGTDVAQVIHGLTAELAANKQALDDNALAIQKVKDQYDPIIKGDETRIAAINVLTPEELARKQDELNLDKAKANLELTKPDTSVYDNKILADQTTLDNMPALDTSTWDTNISGYQQQISDLQDSIASLNTDEFDEKINAIKDKLAEPAPDTTGITNQLKDLNAELAGGSISQADFNTRYGALSRTKQGIETQYTTDTTGLKGQLKLLEQERADQALANKETAQADRASIDTIKDKLSLEEAGRKKAVADDAAARKKLTDDIREEGNLRANALAPYTAAMKKITDAQAINSAKDAAAAAQRALDLAPYQRELDVTKQKESDALAPLLLKKQTLDDNATKLNEQKTYWGQIGTGIKDATTALGEYLKLGSSGTGAGSGGGGGNGGGDNAGAPPPYDLSNVSKYDEFGQPYAAAVPDSPIVTQLKTLKQWLLDNQGDIQDRLKSIVNGFKIEAKLDLSAIFQGVDFVKALAQLISDIYNGNWSSIPDDLGVIRAAGGGTVTPIGVTGGGPNGNGQEIQNGPNLAGQMPQLQNGFSYQQLPPMTINPNPPSYTSGGATPPQHGIDRINAVVDNWLNSHGLGALTSFGRAGQAITGAANPTQSVGAADLDGQMQEVDTFTQHIQDQLGDNGGAQEAIQSFKDQIVKEMGDGSDAATAVQDAEKAFTDKFGDGGSVPAALTQTGAAATTTLGDGGTVPTVLQILRDNHVPLTVSGLLKAFGQGGDAPTAITDTGNQATKTFGAGGTFDQATTNVASKAGSTFGAGGTMDAHLNSFDSKVGGVLGTGGSGQQDMTSFDSHTGSIFGPDGTVIGSFTAVLNWLKGEWQTIGADISKPFTDAWPNIQSFFANLSGGMGWLASNFKLTYTPYGGSGGTLSPDDKNAAHGVGHAAGLDGSMPGHWAMIGEEGPEALYVPAGSTIIPNHLLPGHADGLNLPGIFDALSASRGGNLKGAAGPFTDTLMANLGQPAIPGLDGGGAALTGAVRDGVYNWLKESSVNIGPLAGRSGGGSALAIVNAVKSVTDDPDIWLAMLMAVASEQRTLSGPFVDQIGGGPGRGPFQIEAGPGGSNYGMISEDDARDPTKAARYMVGRFIGAKRGPWGSDNETAGAMTAAAAEVGAAFLAGNPLGYDQSVVDAAYQMATQALSVTQAAAGPFQGGGFPDVLNDARSHLGEMFHAGHEWNLWCEQFAELAGEDVGYPHLGWGTALDHAQGVTLNSGIGPPGSTMLWGSGYYSLGHAAISSGDGSVIGTSSRGISQYDMSGAADYRGWAPPGLKDGAYFPANTPTLAMVGEGPHDEITAPVPMLQQALRDVVRSEGGGTTITVAPGAITVTAPPGVNGQQYGNDFGAGFLTYLREHGRIPTR